MRQRPALGVFGVAQEGGGGGVGQRQVLGVPAGQGGGLQHFLQLALAQRAVKLPFRARGERQAGAMAQALKAVFKGIAGARAVNQFAGGEAPHPVGHFVGGAFAQAHHALGDAEPGQAAAVARALVHGQQQRLRLFIEQFGVSQRAGRHHPHHLALHRPFAAHFAHLLANRHRFALAYQFGQIAFHGMKRNAGHGNGLASALAPVRQGDVQQAGGFFCVRKKHLVKVAHAVEQQCLGIVRFEAQVLGHHGGVRGSGF